MKIEGEINTAVIGAGPGGLMAAKTLGALDPGKTLVFEQGRRKRPKCPVLFHKKDCKGCGGNCHITTGVGGACSDVSCGLLSKYPAGTGLTNYLPVPEIQKIEDGVIDWLEHIHGKRLPLVEPHIDPQITADLERRGIEPKAYPSYEVLGEEFSALVDQMVTDVHYLSNVDVRFSTRMENVEADPGGGFFVTTSNNEKMHANNVIFAGGRSGKYESLDIWGPLGIPVEGMKGYVGFRVEGSVSKELQNLREQVADPKFMRDGVRIFCFCPEGQVVGMRNNPKYGQFAGSPWDCLEGCVQPNTGFGNFSIQQETQFPLDEYVAFMQELIAKQREISGGNIVSQSLRSLVDGTEPQAFPSSVSRRLSTGRMADLLPLEKVLKGLNFLFDLNDIFNKGIITPQTGVHSPELHLWPQMNLGPGFESAHVKGAYVIGDVSGVARGIMQAMVMGTVAAQQITRS